RGEARALTHGVRHAEGREREVVMERLIGDRDEPLVVGCPDVPMPRALGVERRPGELVCPWQSVTAVEGGALTVRRDDNGIHGRGPEHLVADLLAGSDVVLAEDGDGRP